MKKIIVLVIYLSFLVNRPTFAQLGKIGNLEPIDCGNNQENLFCKSIEITKEQVNLKSYLSKAYLVNLYALKNNSLEPILITEIKNTESPLARIEM